MATGHKRWLTTLAIAGAAVIAMALWLRLGSASAGMRGPQPPQSAAAPAITTPSAVRTAPPAAPDRQEDPAPALPARAMETPDLTQTDPALALPGGGNSYCGPVAVSDSLMWLAGHGYERIAPNGSTRKQQQIELVRLISSPHYMGTGPRSGTGAMGVMLGMQKYLRHQGYDVVRLQYEGWRQHPYAFTRHEPHPQIDWIASGVRPHSAAWVNVGWYKKSRYADAYRRNGGHWLSVVAAGIDEHGNPDPAVLVLHDPAPYEDGGPLNVFARARRVDSGWMLDGSSAFPAKGYFQLEGGMYVKRAGEVAIIDGAIVLELAPPR